MIAATDQQESQLCTACFTGKYPIALPASSRLGKNLLERPEGSASDDAVDADAARQQQETLND